MGESGFAERLAYVRWLRNEGRVQPETDAEFAEACGVGKKWLGKWKLSDAAPKGLSEARALEAALAPDGVTLAWLYDGKGAAPRADDWKRWFSKRHPATPKQDVHTARPTFTKGAAAKKAAKRGRA